MPLRETITLPEIEVLHLYSHLERASYPEHQNDIPNGWKVLIDSITVLNEQDHIKITNVSNEIQKYDNAIQFDDTISENIYYQSLRKEQKDYTSQKQECRHNFYSVAFVHEKNKEICIATRGTEYNKTWITENSRILSNLGKLHWDDYSSKFIKHLRDNFEGYTFTHTGHSAGGYVSIRNAILYGEKCWVQDTPFAGYYLEKHYGIPLNHENHNNITYLLSDKNLINNCNGIHSSGKVIYLDFENINKFTQSIPQYAKDTLTGKIFTPAMKIAENMSGHRINNIFNELNKCITDNRSKPSEIRNISSIASSNNGINLAKEFSSLLNINNDKTALSNDHNSILSLQQGPSSNYMDCNGISLIKQTSNQAVFQISPQSALLENMQLHAMLGDINQIDPNQIDTINEVLHSSDTSIRNTNNNKQYGKKPPLPKIPTITSMKFAPVDNDKCGIVASLSNNTVIGIGMGVGGSIFLYVDIQLGVGFMAAFGVTTGIGAAAAAVLLTAGYFYNKHLEKINIKINKDIKHTEQDIGSIAKALNSFSGKIQNIDNADLESVINEANGIISHLHNKIRKEEKHARKSRKHNHSAGKMHFHAATDYKILLKDVSQVKSSLQHDKIKIDFIQENQKLSSIELVELAKKVTKTITFTHNDLAKIEGVRDLIVANVINLFSLGKVNEANKLLAETHELKFYKPGEVGSFSLTALNHKINGHIKFSVVEINGYITIINNCISSGGNPTQIIDQLISKIGDKNDPAKNTYIKDWRSQNHSHDLINQLNDFRIQVLIPLRNQYQTHGNLPESINLSTHYEFSAKLLSDSSQPPSFWIEKLKTLPNEKGNLADDQVEMLRQVAGYFISDGIVKLIMQDKGGDAIIIADQFKSLDSSQSALCDDFIAVIGELGKYNKNDNNYYLEVIKSIRDNPESEGTRDRVKLLYAKAVINNNIQMMAMTGNFSGARELLIDLKAKSSNEEDINKLIAVIDELSPHANDDIDFWIDHCKEFSCKNDDQKSNSDYFSNRIENQFIKNGIIKLILQKKYDLAASHCDKYKAASPAKSDYIDQLKAKIQWYDINQDNNHHFWLDNQNEIMKKSPENQTEADLDSLQINESILLNTVNENSSLGHNKKAAEIVDSLLKISPTPKLFDLSKDLHFRYHGQVINVLIKPIYETIARHVNNMQPSKLKIAASIGVEVVNSAQIIAPNALAWIAQGTHELCVTNEICVSQRNISKAKSEICESLAAPFKNNWNGAMIYSQLILKMTQLIPLSPLKNFISEQAVYKIENIRNNIIVPKWNLTNRSVQTCISGVQLRNAYMLEKGLFSTPYAPSLITSLVSTGVDLGYWIYHQHKESRGEAIVSPEHYLVQNAIGSTLDTIGAVAFIGGISGGVGWLVLGVGAIVSALNLNNIMSEDTKKQCTDSALKAVIANINSCEKTITKYAKNCSYTMKDGIVKYVTDKILNREEICLVKESLTDGTTTYIMHYLDQYGEYCKSEIINGNHWFNLLKSGGYILFDDKHEYYDAIFKATTRCIIEKSIISSRMKLEELLKVFGGVTYNANQLVANVARIVLLHQIVKSHYERKNYLDILSLTQAYRVLANNTIFINNVYQLPPHLASHIITNYRLLMHTEPAYLRDFKYQYQTYTRYINDSAIKDRAWYLHHWETVKNEFIKIHSIALTKFLVEANNSARDKDLRLSYLTSITDHYDYCDEWYNVMNDRSKFNAACLSYSLKDKSKCALFLRNINVPIFLKNNGVFSEQTMGMLNELDADQHERLLLDSGRAALAINDNMLLDHAMKLFSESKYAQSINFLNKAGNFQYKNIAMAISTFNLTNGTKIIESLEMLLNDKNENKDTLHWLVLVRIIETCFKSTKYSPSLSSHNEANVKLAIFIKVCWDKIKNQKNLSHELMSTATKISDDVMENLKTYSAGKVENKSDAQITAHVEKLLEYGHSCLRGDIKLNIMSEIENLISSIAYDYCEQGITKKYLPLESYSVDAKDSWAFDVLEITREKGIALLVNHVKSQSWISRDNPSKTRRDDLVNILLDVLQIKNNSIFSRNQNSFSSNVAIVIKYLESLNKPGVLIPYRQGGCNILNALAFLMNKNIRLFLSDSQGKLAVQTENIYNNQYETINVLCTAKSGFCFQTNSLDHYVKLAYLPLRVVVINNEKTVTETTTLQTNTQASSTLLMLNKLNNNNNNITKTTMQHTNEESKLDQSPRNNVRFGVEIDTLRDGNCAFNAMSLGLCELIEKRQLIHRDEFFNDLATYLRCDVKNQNGVETWLRNNPHSAIRQKMLQFFLRQQSIKYIKKHYDSNYKMTYHMQLSGAFDNYKRSNQLELDDTFLIHNNIKNYIDMNIDTLTSGSLSCWWENEAKDIYFGHLEQGARFPDDHVRWGSDVEMGAIAFYLKINIYYQKDNLRPQLLGIGSGIVPQITEDIGTQLTNLGVGVKFQNYFCLSPFESLQDLRYRLMPLTEKDPILRYLSRKREEKSVTFPSDLFNVELSKKIRRELIDRNVLNNNGQFKMLDINEIDLRLSGVQDNSLREKLLTNYQESVPSFTVRLRENHWRYIQESSAPEPIPHLENSAIRMRC